MYAGPDLVFMAQAYPMPFIILLVGILVSVLWKDHLAPVMVVGACVLLFAADFSTLNELQDLPIDDDYVVALDHILEIRIFATVLVALVFVLWAVIRSFVWVGQYRLARTEQSCWRD
jgi:hypothetical protein